MKTIEDIARLIESDAWMMDVLRTARMLELPDWWVCAGFVRAKVWDTLQGSNERTSLPDIDVVYYDAALPDEREEKRLEARLHALRPGLPWSVKNEARMHLVNGLPPYASAVHAISQFPETATALGAKLDEQDRVVLTAPRGIEDVLDMVVRPTPAFAPGTRLAPIFEARVIQKNWKRIWPNIRVVRE